MKTLFDKAAYEDIKTRVEKIAADAPRQWGTMDAAQMLAHCCGTIEMAVGDKKLPRLFIGRILGPLIKPSFIGEKPLKKGSPTAKPFVMTGKKVDMEAERKRLLELLRRFHEGGETGATKHPHGFFGKLTAAEWGIAQWKHMDHHLRQFGV